MAAQRILRPVPVDVRLPVRQADSIIEVISVLGARRREFRAAVGQRLARLDARADASEMRHTALEQRLGDVEDSVGRLSQRARRSRTPSPRVAVLEHQLELLRTSPNGRRAPGRRPDAAVLSRYVIRSIPRTAVAAVPDVHHVAPNETERPSTDRLGMVLIFIGCLVILWAVLWQLGLALGLT